MHVTQFVRDNGTTAILSSSHAVLDSLYFFSIQMMTFMLIGSYLLVGAHPIKWSIFRSLRRGASYIFGPMVKMARIVPESDYRSAEIRFVA
jgi:hypothetical protein